MSDPLRALSLILALCTAYAGGCSFPRNVDGRHIKPLVEMKVSSAAREIGNATGAALIQGSVVLVAPELQEHIQSLAEELARAACCDVEVQVHILNNPLVNMLTLPNGDIIVFTGFLDIIESKDELAFALGHEIAHLTQDHGVRQMRRNFRIQQTGAVIGAFLVNIVTTAVSTSVSVVLSTDSVGIWGPLYDVSVVGPVSGAMARMAAKVPEALVVYAMTAASHAYSREQELEADELGVAYMKRAGYNPEAAIKVIDKFDEIWHPE